MSIDFERTLRATMAQAPIRPRPDVVRAAFRRSRRRQVTTRAAIAAGTAVVAAAAVIAVTGRPAQPRVETTAYVVSQMSSALAAANDDIMYVRQGGVDSTPSGYESFGFQYWFYGSRSRMLADYGGVKGDSWSVFTHVPKGTMEMTTNVDYRSRTAGVNPQVWTYTFTPGLPDCNPPVSVPLFAPGEGFVETASWLAGSMRALLSCASQGQTATWNQRVNGTEAVRLESHIGATTYWVDISQATFLPIGEGFTSTVKADGSESQWYAWLPPTKANLAKLTGTIPAGFTVTHGHILYDTKPNLSLPRSVYIKPAITGNGPAATLARRMTGSLTSISHEIEVITQDRAGEPGGNEVLTIWTYPDKLRIRTVTAGKPLGDNSTITTPAGPGKIRQVTLSVDYKNREVRQQSAVVPTTEGGGHLVFPTPAQVCGQLAMGFSPGMLTMGFSPQDGAGYIPAIVLQDLLACPHVTVAITGQQRHDGVAATKVVYADAKAHTTTTFWLSEPTNTLIGISMSYEGGSSAQVTWLPPARASLALFNVSYPPGFAGAQYVSR